MAELEDYSAEADDYSAEAEDYSSQADDYSAEAEDYAPVADLPRLGDKGGPSLRAIPPAADRLKPFKNWDGRTIKPETKEVAGTWFIKNGAEIVTADTGEPVVDPKVLEAFGQSKPSKQGQINADTNAALGPRVTGNETLRMKDGRTMQADPAQTYRGEGVAPPAPKDQTRLAEDAPTDYGDFGNAFLRAAGPQNLKLSGHTLKAIEEATGDATFTAEADDLIRQGEESEKGIPAARVGSYKNIDGIGSAVDYAQEAMGSGLGSTIIPLTGGMAGAAFGRRFGKVGGRVGAFVGAFSGSNLLNIGSMRETLIAEGVEDPALRGKTAVAGGLAMSALDSLVPGEIAESLTGSARRELEKTIARRLLAGAVRGMAKEGATEAAQDVLQLVVAKDAAGKPITMSDIVDTAIESGLQGAISGTAMGGVGEALSSPSANAPEQTVNRTARADPLSLPPPAPPAGAQAGPTAQPAPKPAAKKDEPQGPDSAQVAVLMKEAGYNEVDLAQMDRGELQAIVAEAKRTGRVAPKGSVITPPVSEVVKSQPAPVAPEAEDYSAEADDVPHETAGDGTPKKPVTVTTEADIEKVRAQVAPEPTDGQKDALNYKQAHVKLHGLDIAIETPKGGIRRSKKDGPQWESPPMPADYGRIKGSTNSDGEEMDVYIGPNPGSNKAFVINQIDPETSDHDEFKTLIGFDSLDEAEAAYEGAFSDGSGPSRIGGVEEMDVSQLKDWMASLSKPKSVGDKPKSVTEIQPQKPQDATSQTEIQPEKAIQPLASDQDEKIDTGVAWDKAKPGDRLVNGSTLVRKGIVTRAAANRMAAELGGTVIRDGAKKFAVVKGAGFDAVKPRTPEPLAKDEHPGLVIKSLQTGKETTIQPKGTRKPSEWKEIGVNEAGNPVFEDENGVRSFTRDGIRNTEKMAMLPGGRFERSAPKGQYAPAYTPVTPKAEPAATKQPEPAPDDDFDAIFKEEMEAAYGKKAEAPARILTEKPAKSETRKPAKSAGAAAKSAAVNTAKGIDEAMSALTKLFGADPTRLGAGIGPDDETYKKAVPHFKAAIAHFGAAGKDIRELVRAVVQYFRERGMAAETLTNMQPHLKLFIAQVEAGKESLDANESAGIRGPAPQVSPDSETEGSDGSEGERGTERVSGKRGPVGGGTVRRPGNADDDRSEPADRPGAKDSGDRGDSADGGRDRAGKRRLSAEIGKREQERRARSDLNYRITAEDKIGQGGPKERVRANIEAIRVLKNLDGRLATAEEKAKLVKYVGWGAFAQDLFDTYRERPEWKAERADLQNLLSPDEYAAARASTTNAHYTSESVIRGMWDAIEHLGFTGGRALEPSSGVGHFIGLIPDKLRGSTDWSAVELDTTTGNIAKALYGGADVNVQGFETFVRPKGFYDLAISNVPFGNYKLRDPKYPRLSIHDYFFVKSLDKVRPGGIVAFITSSHSMDKMDDKARVEIGKRGDLIGAIRLPGGKKGAFAGNAGTEVTTDILFLRRRPDGEPASPEAQRWGLLKEIKTPDGPARINEYFADHPEMMLGTMRLTGTMYGSNEPMLEGTGEDVGPLIAKAARKMPANVFQSDRKTGPTKREPDEPVTIDGAKPGAFFERKGKIYQNIDNDAVPQSFSADDAKRVRDLIGVRDIVNELLGNQAKGENETNDALRKRLAKAYDAFVKAWGPINKTDVTVTSRLNKKGENIVGRKMPNFNAFRRDPDAYKVAAIEMYDPDTDKATKAAIFDVDVIGTTPEPVIASPLDTIAVSLNKHGRLDTKDMADMAGLSEDDLIDALGERIYLDPTSQIYETLERYLSGDVVTKLNEAKAAAQSDKAYERNVEALEKVQPAPLTREDIGVSFGGAWIPKDVFEQFLADEADAEVQLTFNDYSKAWGLKSASRSAAAQAKFGTAHVSFEQIIVAALNSTPYRVMDKQSDGTLVVNADATEQAKAKIDEMQTAFAGDREKGIEGWVFKDEERARRLEAIYNNQFNRLVPQVFDGSHLTFPGLAKTIKKTSGEIVPFRLRKHQSDAAWRIIQNGNTLLDHVVGAGKTFTMIVAGMEMRRLGQISRPVYSVPNHMLEQFSREFLQAYPGANILVADKAEMKSDNRRAFAAKVAAQKWDGVIMTHSGFGRVKMSDEAYADYLTAEINEAEDAIANARAEEGKKSQTVKEIEKTKKRLETKLSELIKAEAKDAGITFEELGIDNIFVDEAHLFKNLSFFTRHTRIKGIGGTASQRATDLFMKIQHIEKRRPGHSAVFATGTPISNTMAEAYTMQRYLQLPVLRAHGIDRFDAWASTFGKVRTQMELAPNGRTLQEVTSFSKFINIPEMMNIFGLVADTKTAADLNLPRPTLATGKPILVEAEPDAMEERYIAELVRRSAEVKGKRAEKGGDNMLKIVTDGRKIATDRRLIFGDVGFNPNGKVARAVENIWRIYQAGQEPALVQTVFLDMGTPKSKGGETTKTVEDEETGESVEVDMNESEMFKSAFNLYDDIKKRLIEKGIPASEIAFIHDANDDTKKARLFDQVRRAKKRVLIGSTQKMGVGTNIPDRLIAQHNIDATWKPAEIEQRDGRIVRQGNLNPDVSIYRYITVRSFDAFMWQTLERKANFIAQIKAGARGLREAEDIDSPLPDAAELKAAATGDPRIMEYAELQKEVRSLQIAESAHFRTIAAARSALASQRSQKESTEKAIAILEADTAKVTDTRGDKFKVELTVGQSPGEYTDREDAGAQVKGFLLGQLDKIWGTSTYTIGKISGLTMKVSVKRTQKGGGHEYTALLEGAGNYGVPVWADGFINAETEESQFIQRWERLLRGIPDSLTHRKGELEKINVAIPKLEITAKDKPFPRVEELRTTKEKFKALEAELKPADPKAAPAPEQGTLSSLADRAGGFAKQPPYAFAISEKQRAEVKAEVMRLARRVLGFNVKVVVVDKIDDEGTQGYYDPNDRTIYVAIQTAMSAPGTLRHEAIHALRDAGLISKAEWKELARYAEKIWLKRHPEIRRTYEELYRDRFAITEEQLNDLIVEEAVADMMEQWAEGRLPDNVPGAIRAILKKIADFLAAVRKALEGMGFKSASDIFEGAEVGLRAAPGILSEIEAGNMAGRDAKAENTRGYLLWAKEGQGDLASRRMPPSRPPQTSFDAPEDSAMDIWRDVNRPLMERLPKAIEAGTLAVRRAMQDSMVDWKRVQKAIEARHGQLRAAFDVYMAETLYSGRTGERLERFREDELLKVLENMASLGVSQEEVDQYLYAKAAPSRNAYIASINPALPDGGSGMTDAEARQIIDDMRQSGRLLRIARAARPWYALRDRTNDRFLNNNLISQDVYDAFDPKYVPLQGFKDGPDIETRLAIGNKYDTRAKPVKTALGRRSKADSPTAYLIAQAQQSIVLAEKARVGRTLLRLARQFPQTDLWEVDQVVTVKYLDKQTGLVATFRDGRQRTMAENVLAVREGDKLYWVTLHHEGLLKGVKNLEASQINVVLRGMARAQRFYALMRTGINPSFFVPNFLRDLQTAGIHISAEQGRAILKNTFRDIPKAIAATWRHDTLKRTTGNQWVQYAHEQAMSGGKVGIFGLKDIEAIKRQIAADLRRAEGGGLQEALKAWDRTYELMMGVNGALENAIRLSLYVNMTRAGFSRDQAASASKDVTVNFNRKGTSGQTANALYVFFNAAIQGIVRVLQVMKRYPKVRNFLYGTVLAGVLMDFANAWFSGDDDDDGENQYDQIGDWERNRSFIIMLPWSDHGERIKLPMAFTYSVFPYTGQQIGRMIRGKISPTEAALNVALAFAQAANPLYADSIALMAAPTFLDPFIELYSNKDYKGDPIYKEKRDFEVTKPDSQMYFKSVNPAIREVTDALNEGTGGDEIRPGAIDVNPEIVEYWWNFAGGGVSKFLGDSLYTATKLAQGEMPETHKIPLLSTVYGSDNPYQSRDEFYKIREQIRVSLEQLENAKDKKDFEAQRAIKRKYRADFRMADDLKKVDKELKDLKKRMNEAKTSAARNRFQERMDKKMADFRKKYRRLKRESE